VGQTRKGRLGKVASIRLYRLAALVVSAERVIGDSVNAATWLDKSSYGLGGLRPIDLVVSEFGVRMVEDELVRIEHGMLA
jgi:putative toxin-antitoxin system antitoxin component (TIGR02293 family)